MDLRCEPSPSSSSLTFRRSVKRKSDGRDAIPPQSNLARVDVENELGALRETLASQQITIQELSAHLEEERSAAATATSETMSMILRLQSEKSDLQMEARQFRRFAEEKMAHDGCEIAQLSNLLFKREQQLQAYKKRLLSLGIIVDWEEGEFVVPDYPPLRCERSLCREEEDETDRIYTIDAVHGVIEEKGLISGDWKEESGVDEEEDDIKKLCMRMQALEADRESMRQAIVSMTTEKAQFALFREIAQQLCKEVKQERKVVKKSSSLFQRFSLLSFVEWVLPFLFWRKKESRIRYTFGLSNINVGLLLILDKSAQIGHWQCLTRATLRR